MNGNIGLTTVQHARDGVSLPPWSPTPNLPSKQATNIRHHAPCPPPTRAPCTGNPMCAANNRPGRYKSKKNSPVSWTQAPGGACLGSARVACYCSIDPGRFDGGGDGEGGKVVQAKRHQPLVAPPGRVALEFFRATRLAVRREGIPNAMEIARLHFLQPSKLGYW